MFSLSSVIGNSGGLSNFIDKTTTKYRPVYLFPSVIVPMKDKNTAVIDFVSQLFRVTEPNRVQKTLTILKRTLTLIENSSAAQNHCNLPEDSALWPNPLQGRFCQSWQQMSHILPWTHSGLCII